VPTEGVTAGKESRYINKVLSDERTNSLIVLANEEGHQAVRDLIEKIDIEETVANLRERNRILEIENKALRDSRDMYQNQNAELIKANKKLQKSKK
jgi:type II secretory pathway component GspD/PulD (secretin)